MALTRITPQSADRACFLVIGPAGCGKTSQVRCILGEDYRPEEGWISVSEGEKALVLSAEAGLLSARELVASGRVEGFEIRSLQDFRDALKYCQSREFMEAGYLWVFIDSLTEIAARCVEDLADKFKDARDTIKMWGEYNSTMTALIKAFRDMPRVNVVFTCLVSMEKDAAANMREAPDISGGALKNRLVSYFDEVLVMDDVPFEGGVKRRVFKTRAPFGLAKDRSGKLSEYEWPNILDVRNKILH